MMGFFWNLSLLASLLVPTTAWHMLQPTTSQPYHDHNRRTFLVQTPLVVAASLAVVPHPAAAAALSDEAATAQWQAAVKTIDNLLENWDSIAKGGGDAIRTELGTQGISSPLFQIDKALKVLRDKVEDIIEFTEMSDEFSLTLSRADSMAYSANFAGGSGKPTPPAVYLDKSRKEVIDLQKIAKSLSSQL